MNYPPWISMCWWVGVVGWDEKERKQYKYDVVILLLLWPYVELVQYQVVFLSLFLLLFLTNLVHQSAPMDHHHRHYSHPFFSKDRIRVLECIANTIPFFWQSFFW